ncbi:hypothetical protein ABK040_013468 [Willaertia magna]
MNSGNKILQESLEEMIEKVLNPGEQSFYVLNQLGVSQFIIKHLGMKYKVSIGSMNECTCLYSKKKNVKNNCIHILFVLLKVFKLAKDSHLIKQTSYSELEINNIVSYREAKVQKRREIEQKKEGNGFVNPRPFTDGEDCCPICMEELYKKDIDTKLVYCRISCGNYLHASCLKEYFESNKQRTHTNICPFCRANWGNDLTSQLTLLKKNRSLVRNNVKKCELMKCSGCEKIIESSQHKSVYVCYTCLKCKRCVTALCNNCFATNEAHSVHSDKYLLLDYSKVSSLIKQKDIKMREEEMQQYMTSRLTQMMMPVLTINSSHTANINQNQAKSLHQPTKRVNLQNKDKSNNALCTVGLEVFGHSTSSTNNSHPTQATLNSKKPRKPVTVGRTLSGLASRTVRNTNNTNTVDPFPEFGTLTISSAVPRNNNPTNNVVREGDLNEIASHQRELMYRSITEEDYETLLGLEDIPKTKFPSLEIISAALSNLNISDNSDDCIICMESDKNDMVSTKYCGHSFHKSCISKWLLERSCLCPICNLDLLTEVENEQTRMLSN